MQNSIITISPDTSTLYWENINGIQFTRREIDIIACILGGRAVKKIASLLFVAPRTVETHIRNITNKLACSSREGVIDFIERSGNAPLFRNYYQSLVAEADFIKKLEEISKLTHHKTLVCRILYSTDQKVYEHLIHQIEKHLERVGLKAILDKKGTEQLTKSLEYIASQKKEHVIYIIPELPIEKSNVDGNEKHLECSYPVQAALKNPDFFTFICLSNNKGGVTQEFEKIGYIHFEEQENYHLFFFKILGRLLSDINFEKIVSEFKTIHGSSQKEFFVMEKKSKNMSPENSYFNLVLNNRKRWLIFFSVVGIIIFYVGLSLLRQGTILNTSQKNMLGESQIIRSELFVPNEAAFLNRRDFIGKIKENFQGQQEIEVVVLSGIGGAGKTTLARSYAHQQNSKLVWEINAETRESLMNAFEDLAYALSNGENDRKKLGELQSITNAKEREKILILLVKEKLKGYPNWFLVYDNVERFSDIHDCFPHDSRNWGRGRVIITTRDNTFKNKDFRTLRVEELSKQEKFDLFIKILRLEQPLTSDPSKKLEIHTFLEKIPSFPLDVSTAAYYLKTANISYQDYLDRMEQNKGEFKRVQENIAHESSGYKKNRYGIITLSLEQIIANHKDFRELLLLISLLDSQNIPRDLLGSYKSREIVDSLLHNLKKNSFIVNESSPLSQMGSTFSLHRSTQEIILHYFMEKSGTSEYRKILPLITSTVEKYVSNELHSNDLKHFNFMRLKLITKHGGSFLTNKNLLNDISKENLLITAHLSRSLGIIYRELGDFQQSETLLEKSYLIFKEHSGKENLEMAKSLGNLAVTLGFLGNHIKAQECHKKALSAYYKNYDKDQLEIGWLSVHFGNTNRDLGQFEEARTLYKESYRIFLKNNRKNHYYTAWCLGNLGDAYRRLGYDEKARDILEESLRIYKNYYAESILRHAWVSIHLGKAYISLSDYEKARKFLEKSLEIYHNKYGKDNIKNIEILVHLAHVYTKQGDYDKAQNLLEKSIQAYKNYYGETHVTTAAAIQRSAECHLRQGNLDLAEASFKKALEIFQKAKHSEIYICLENLAELYLEKAKQVSIQAAQKQPMDYKKRAINCLQEALKTLEAHFPKSSPHIQRIESKLNQLHSSIA